MSAIASGYQGAATPTDGANDFNALTFVIRRMLNRRAVSALVRVVACTNAGALAVTGTVDVLPLVNQLDGAGNAVPHDTVYGLLYFRLQGGANAIIIDPSVGDIGHAIFCDRDISTVKATRGQANPGSFRRNSMSDGVYLGGVLNGLPSQFIRFGADGVSITSPNAVTIIAPAINLNP